MREQKKHWVKKQGYYEPSVSLCGKRFITFANAKRKVTCKTCQRILAGYTGEVK